MRVVVHGAVVFIILAQAVALAGLLAWTCNASNRIDLLEERIELYKELNATMRKYDEQRDRLQTVRSSLCFAYRTALTTLVERLGLDQHHRYPVSALQVMLDGYDQALGGMGGP